MNKVLLSQFSFMTNIIQIGFVFYNNIGKFIDREKYILIQKEKWFSNYDKKIEKMTIKI